MALAPALSTSASYEKTSSNASLSIPAEMISSHYYLDACAAEIKRHEYKTVALQFPDSLLRDSALVCIQLTRLVDAKVFVLADTSYSACCVDEIAAQHVNADCVVHFGDSCLNEARAMPVIYNLHGSADYDPEKVAETVLKWSNSLEDGNRVLLVGDSTYTLELMKLVNAKVDVAVPKPKNAVLVPEIEAEGYCLDALPNRIIMHAKGNNSMDLDKYTLVYVSNEPSESLLLFWSTLFDVKAVNSKGAELEVFPALRRRYRDVQAVKAAGTIGILVNTLSLAGSLPLLERIKAAIIKADKKHYTFVFGKPNVAKLGNFDVVDVWVVLGCPQGGVSFGSEYLKPVVTPYEIELAVKDEWTGKWLLKFDEVLATDFAVPEREEPLFDLITGKFVFNEAPLKVLHDQSTELGTESSPSEVAKSSTALTIQKTVSTAAEKLHSKAWTGLGSDHVSSEQFAELKVGRSGIARDYGEHGE